MEDSPHSGPRKASSKQPDAPKYALTRQELATTGHRSARARVLRTHAASDAWNDDDSDSSSSRLMKTHSKRPVTCLSTSSTGSTSSESGNQRKCGYKTVDLCSDLPLSSDDSDSCLSNDATKKLLTSKTLKKKAALPVTKQNRLQQQKEVQCRLKELLREEKAEQRRRLKETRAIERQQAKEARIESERASKQLKTNLREQIRQQNGGYCRHEITILMERKLYQNSKLDLSSKLKSESFHVEEYDSLLGCNAIQWIRNDYLKGGAASAVLGLHKGNTSGYKHLPSLAIVFDDPKDFVKLLERDQDGEENDDYPKLATWLQSVEAGWAASWKYGEGQRPTVVLFLLGIDRTLKRLWTGYHSRTRARSVDVKPPPSDNELHDAIAWMLIQFQVDCVKCQNVDAILAELTKMTFMLAREPYQRLYTDLDCIPKFKRSCVDSDPLMSQAKDVWRRQLQVISGMSLAKARSLTQHYPTAHSLWQAYQNPDLTEAEKHMLVANLLSERQEVKLSSFIYQVLTSDNPHHVIR